MTRIRIIFAAAALFAIVPGLGSSVSAQLPDFVEHIDRYDVTMQLGADGLLHVHEEITYNFGTAERHGIIREIPVRETYGTDGKYDRIYRISDVRVSAEIGVPAETKQSTSGGNLVLRVGDPDRFVTGSRRYEIDYTVKGAPTGFDDHDELYWDGIGTGWNVPIENATVTVEMPAPITEVGCAQGAQGSRLACDASSRRGARATFRHASLGSHEGLTVVVGIPTGVIKPAPAPILDERWNLNSAFARRVDTTAAAGGVALLGVGGVLLLAYRRGRDRRYAGSAVDQAFGNAEGIDEPIPLFDRNEGPVEFVPPDDVRPGQVGLLIDEHANVLDVTATIVDLAVRGYLRIVELEPEGFLGRRHDYELQQLPPPQDGPGGLLAYEQRVLSGLFESGATVKLSDLKYKFRDDLSKVQEALYQDAISRHWFRNRPDHTRLVWRAIAVGLVVAGVVLTFVAAAFTSFGLVPLAVVLTGIVLFVVAGRMPARTSKGSAALSRVRGFRRLFDEGEEDLRARFAEEHNIFSQYLPYAIVFGCTDKWARVFEGLDDVAKASWYSGHSALSTFALVHAMDDFGTTATGTLYASQPSSSSSSSGFSSGGGFSGGGGGGGGGSSW